MAVYRAVLDSLHNACCEDRQYLDPQVLTINRRSGYPADSQPSVVHPPEILAALLQSGWFAATCRVDTLGTCAIPLPGVTFQLSPLYRWHSSDTVLVAIGQARTFPPSSPDSIRWGFWSFEHMLVSRGPKGWSVVHVDLKVIT